jgi:hypothetical protein
LPWHGAEMQPISLPLISISYLVLTAYLLLKDTLPGMDGQSFGKKVWGVRVVRARDRQPPCGIAASTRRNLPLVFPPMYLVELIAIATDPQGRRLGDRWGGTLVVAGPTGRQWAWLMGGFLGPTIGQSLLAALHLAGVSGLPSYETVVKSNSALAVMAVVGGAAMAWLQWAFEPLDREETLIRLPRWMRLVATLVLAVSLVSAYRMIAARNETRLRGNMLLVTARNTAHDSFVVQRDVGNPAEFEWASPNFPLKERSDGRFEMQTEMRIKGPYGNGVLRGIYLDHPYEAQSLRWEFQGLSIPLDKTGRWADTQNPDMAKAYYAAENRLKEYQQMANRKDFAGIVAAWTADRSTVLRYFANRQAFWDIVAPACEKQGQRTEAASIYTRIAQKQLWVDLAAAKATLAHAQALDPSSPDVQAAAEDFRRDLAKNSRAPAPGQPVTP